VVKVTSVAVTEPTPAEVPSQKDQREEVLAFVVTEVNQSLCFKMFVRDKPHQQGRSKAAIVTPFKAF
jgi:hypothetical protein